MGTGSTHITATGLKPLSPEEPPPIQEMVETTPAKEFTITKLVVTTKKTKKRRKNMVTLAFKGNHQFVPYVTS